MVAGDRYFNRGGNFVSRLSIVAKGLYCSVQQSFDLNAGANGYEQFLILVHARYAGSQFIHLLILVIFAGFLIGNKVALMCNHAFFLKNFVKTQTQKGYRAECRSYETASNASGCSNYLASKLSRLTLLSFL